jgi:hypothetical protein
VGKITADGVVTIRRRQQFDLAVRRRREIEAHARHLGAAETDDFDRWLIAWIWHNKESKDQLGAVIEAARRMGRKGMRKGEATRILAEAKLTRKCRSADNLARFLGLPFELRQDLGITTIGSTDVNKRERKERRKLNKLVRDRKRMERKRRKAGRWHKPIMASSGQSIQKTGNRCELGERSRLPANLIDGR